MAEFNLDPWKTLAYLPRHAWRRPMVRRAGRIELRVAGSALESRAPLEPCFCGPPSSRQARRPAEALGSLPRGKRTAHKDVQPHRPIAPGNAESVAPLGPVIFGGFFYAPAIQTSP